MILDGDAVSRHIRRLDAAFAASPLPWEIGTYAALEALHVVASRRDRAFAARLFRQMAKTYDEPEIGSPG